MVLTVFSPDPAPEHPLTVDNEPQVNRIQFGEGYSQRVGFDVNPVIQKLTLTWKAINKTETDTLDAFFLARGGTEAFSYTIPGEASAKAWTCGRWSKVLIKGSVLYDFTAELQQEFDE